MNLFEILKKVLISKKKNNSDNDNFLIDNYSLVVTDNGFNIVHKNEIQLYVEWDKISKVATYKADLLTTDLICLEIHIIGDEKIYEVHEEMKLFSDFCQALSDNLDLINSNWYMDVMLPAFKTNYTIIYKKKI